ncbi:hypothetical protein, partial [Rhizobium leguminosarum]|uniref:hypothetical protein n=1 Tax=Rhizobium leguminosarum TaxID=384 RepID=UPI003F955E52
LRHAKRYSGFFSSICTNPAWTGFTMATGTLRGPDPREIVRTDFVVIWGTNAVSTQINGISRHVGAIGVTVSEGDVHDGAG